MAVMRTSECEILIVPGVTGSGPDHWQSRWQQKLSTARRVEQDDWERPQRDAWTARLVQAVEAAAKPVVLVAHSLGVVAVAHAAPSFRLGKVGGAFLVALPDIEEGPVPGVEAPFAPIPRDPFPFPSILVASRSDPYCAYDRAEEFSYAWGSALADAGDAGHLNTASGHGPWPEGLMRFAGFLARLQPA
jgi:predicted alpha/beta hydrolase family esterase